MITTKLDIDKRTEQAFDDAKAKAEAEAHAHAHGPIQPRDRTAGRSDTAADVDRETEVLHACVVALARLDPTARARVQLYLARRFGGHYE